MNMTFTERRSLSRHHVTVSRGQVCTCEVSAGQAGPPSQACASRNLSSRFSDASEQNPRKFQLRFSLSLGFYALELAKLGPYLAVHPGARVAIAGGRA